MVYKCALNSRRITELLVKFYNVLMQNVMYVQRWIRTLDIIIEKGKGPVLGKLQITQLIEADLQLLMRICIDARKNNQHENMDALSKYNFGSRKGYSIESALLEKRLTCDYSQYSGERMVHKLSDLEACYDRQLPRIGRIVEEVLGVERQPMMLFEKVLPIMQHHTSTSYGISEKTHGGINNELCGTGQGNSLSGTLCRYMSCLAFKHVENVRKVLE